MEPAALVSALVALAPAFAKAIEAYLKTPEEQRGDFVEKTELAFQKLKDGDTSAVEKMMDRS